MYRTTALALFLTCLVAFCVIFTKPASASDVATADSWTSNAALWEPRAHLGAAVVGGKIYVIGGDVGYGTGRWASIDFFSGEVTDTNREYNPETDKYSTKEVMPTARALFGIAVYQNKIYCIGGYYAVITFNETGPSDFEYFNTGANEVYDPATNTWETKSSMPVPSAYADSSPITANVVDGKIYLIGNGVNNFYDPATDSWTAKTPSPYQITGYGSVVVDDEIWFIGANSNPSTSQVDSFFQIYTPQNDSWEKGASCPTYGSTAAIVATTGVNAPKRIYIFDFATTYSYDPVANSWETSSASMPAPCIISAVAVVNDIFYIMGGRMGQQDNATQMSPTVGNHRYTPIGYSRSDSDSPSPLLLYGVVAAVAAITIITLSAIALKKRQRKNAS